MQVICKHLLARLAFRAFPGEKFRAFGKISKWLDAAVGWGSGIYNKYNGRAKLLFVELMPVGKLIVEFIPSCSGVCHNFAAGVFMLLQSPCVVMTSHENVSVFAPQVGSFCPSKTLVITIFK